MKQIPKLNQWISGVEHELSSALCNGHGNPFLPLPLFSSALLVLCWHFASLETNTTQQGLFVVVVLFSVLTCPFADVSPLQTSFW